MSQRRRQTPRHGFATRVIHAGQAPDPIDRRDHAADLRHLDLRAEQPRRAQGPRLRPLAQPDALGARALRRRPRRRRAGASPSPRGWRRSRPCSSCSTPARTSSPATTCTAAPSACSSAVRQRSAGHALQLRRPDRPGGARGGAARPTRSMVWVETPTNPLLQAGRPGAPSRSICRARGIIARGRQHLRQPVRAAPAGARLRHRRALDHQVPQRPLRRDRRRRRGRRRATPNWRERLGFLQNAVGAIAGPVRQLPRAARREDAGAAHGAPLRERAGAGAVAGDAAAGRARCTTRACASHPQHALAQAADARLRRHDLAST